MEQGSSRMEKEGDDLLVFNGVKVRHWEWSMAR